MKIIQTVCGVLLFIPAILAADPKPAANPPLSKEATAIFQHYLLIQTELATDSIKNLKTNASLIAIAAKTVKDLPDEVAKQVEALGQAKDIKAARAALKPLSTSLLTYRSKHAPLAGTYEAYCPMVDASWLQEGKKLVNPYMGKAMLECGILKE